MKKSTCSLLSGLLILSGLHAQNQPAADPFVRHAESQAAAESHFTPRVVSICIETFSLEMSEAAALYHQGVTDSKIYAELTARVAKGQAKQETFSVIRARSGEKALSESISEFIYPTEFEHGNPANTTPTPAPTDNATPPAIAAPARPAIPIIPSPVLPTAFETRNVGATLEVEPVIAENGQMIDLRLAPELVTLVDRTKWGQGISETELPVFETQRINIGTTVISGQPQLLGTPSRPPASKVDADSANRVWFSFVTATIIGVAKEK